MTRRDNLLDWLEEVNPVPDPSQLDKDAETSRPFHFADEQGRERTGSGTKIERLTPGVQGSRIRQGVLVAALAAALVIIVGAIGSVTAERADVAGSGSRVLRLAFDGEQCTYEGPRMLSEGEVEITWHNESAERVWGSFLRLDDDKTTQDILDYAADVSNRDKPSWTQYASPFWSSIQSGGSTEPRVVTVGPGLHVLICGTWTPYVGYLGSDLTVVE